MRKKHVKGAKYKKRQPPQAAIEVVYGGGGIKGFGHIGLLKAIEENNVDTGMHTGVSIGSVIATFVANGYKAKEIEAIFLKEFGNIDPDLLGKTLRWRGLKRFLKAGGLIDFSELLKSICERYNLKPQPNLRIIAFNVRTYKAVVFEGTDYCLHEALTASCSIPGIMRPVWYGRNCRTTGDDVGHESADVLVDGGLHHPNPGNFSEHPAIISALGFANKLPMRWLKPADFLFHMIELFGAALFQWCFDDLEPDHIVIKVGADNVGIVTAGLSPKDCRKLIDHGYKVANKEIKKATKEKRIPVKKTKES
jgi:hypothetical protein